MRTKEEILQGEDENYFLTKCYLDPKIWFERVLGFELKDFHKEWIDMLVKYDRIAIEAPTGFGKCFGKGTKMIMFDGTIKDVENISTGDLLMGDDSTPRKVISTTKGQDNLYIVKQKNGNNYIVNEPHILSLKMNHNAGGCKKGEIVDINIKDYFKKSKTFRHCAKGFKVGINFDERNLHIDPYFLGLWLGDGDSDGQGISNIDKEVIDYIKKYATELSLNYSEVINKRCNRHSIVGIRKKKNILLEALRNYNLINNKHIPLEFKFNSKINRLKLLAGIVDTDGYTCDNVISIIQKSEILSNDIVYLARSLGFRVSLRKVKKSIKRIKFTGDYYEIIISGNTNEIPIQIPRKKCSKRKINKCPLNTGIIIEPIGKGDYFGFEIEGSKKRFLLEDFTVVHNTTIFGIGYPLYLAFFKKKSICVIVSKTIRTQSATILEQIKHHIEDNEILIKLLPENANITWSKDKLTCTNKSEIIYSSYSANIRGIQADYVFADEVATYADEVIFYRDVATRVNSKKGKLAAVSTPVNTTDLLAQLMSNNEYHSASYPAIKNGISIWPEKYSVEFLEKLRRELGESNFQKNYMVNAHAESESPVFKLRDVEDCYDLKNKFVQESSGLGRVIIGGDFAISSGPRADYDSYTVIEQIGDICNVLWAERHRGVPIASKIIRLKQLHEKYKSVRIILDESSIGQSILQELRSDGLPVEAQSFSSSSRAALLTNLLRIIENKKLVIPRGINHPNADSYTKSYTDKLTEELISFKEVESKTTKVKHLVSESAHDDTAISLAMACKGAGSRKTFTDYIASGN